MTRTSKTAKAVVLAGAVAASALVVSPASAAGETVTKAGPLRVAQNVASTAVISGTNFGSDIAKVGFADDAGASDCVSEKVVIASATQIYVSTPTASCSTGPQFIKLLDAEDNLIKLFTPAPAVNGISGNTVNFIAPQVVTGIAPTTPTGGSAPSPGGLTSGGTNVTVTTSTTLPSTGIKATLGGKPMAAITRTSNTTFTAKTPAGVAGDAKLVVEANGVPSAAFPAAGDADFATKVFSYKQAIKLGTTAWVKGAAAPEVKIDGQGFKPLASGNATPAVTFCGAPATVVTTGAKAYTDKVLYVTAPAWSAVEAGGVDADAGGACGVQVTVDSNGTATDVEDQVNPTTVLTSTSTFTYAAY